LNFKDVLRSLLDFKRTLLKEPQVESNHFAALVPFNASRDATDTPNPASDGGVPLRIDFTRGHHAGAGLHVGTQCAPRLGAARLTPPCAVDEQGFQ
jgi:hypothetical protein